MCKLKDNIEILLKDDKSKIATSIKLLANMVDKRFTEHYEKVETFNEVIIDELKDFKEIVTKKEENISQKFKDLEIFTFLVKYKWVFWLSILGFILLLGNSTIETIKLFIK